MTPPISLHDLGPVPSGLACQDNPDLWFDPESRQWTRSWCLQCPLRAACAGEALRVGATDGMWGGVWLPGLNEAYGLGQAYRQLGKAAA